ncbi:chemotaxis protein CheB [Haliangium ochraceum]|uniref:protein-glutamate methylesterase n=1 Tax=Haliangium ochraceum (strain DSM 14365 / JCM 11303 / SMP-2) TaxID=502025 RepID=D0LTR0_HALO1|nr:chemotaxis protein CheB [Haliangium ochraceum]ACY15754.1 response regulator receiver modulated CheB methylesterase [Haliangium ochraceum DSM 14365]
MTTSLRVAVFNDSATMRAAIRAALDPEPDIAIVAERGDANDAAEVVARSDANAVIMDVVMPGVDGYEATRDIMRNHPTPIVMVSSVVDAKDASVVFAALEAGALHIASPPPAPGMPEYSLRCAAFAELLRVVAGARPRTVEPTPTSATRTPPRARLRASAGPIDAIGIAASAGGPQALNALLRALPAGMPPLLLVQHLAAGFSDSFAHWLSESTGHPVHIAAAGMPLHRGHVYMAPDDNHLGITLDLRVSLSKAPAIGGFRPSADALFTSMSSLGARALGVILSGMGRDGADGALALRRAGGHIAAQSLESAAVTGMPSAAAKSGAASSILDPQAIARWLVSRSRPS